MDEPVSLRRHLVEHGFALYDPLRALASRESFFFRPTFPLFLFLAFSFFFVLQRLFVITPLNVAEWKAVFWISIPVIVMDEVLKFISNSFFCRFYSVFLEVILFYAA